MEPSTTGDPGFFRTLADRIASNLTLVLAGALAVTLLVTGVGLSVLWAARESSETLTTRALTTNDGEPLVPESERARVKAVAEQFCLNMDNVDGSDPDGYAKRVKALLTTKQKAAFDQQFGAIQRLETDKSVKGQGKIVVSGVADIDSDSATVLVAHDTLVTSDAGPVQRHARWTVSLRKINGRWLVDNWDPAS